MRAFVLFGILNALKLKEETAQNPPETSLEELNTIGLKLIDGNLMLVPELGVGRCFEPSFKDTCLNRLWKCVETKSLEEKKRWVTIDLPEILDVFNTALRGVLLTEPNNPSTFLRLRLGSLNLIEKQDSSRLLCQTEPKEVHIANMYTHLVNMLYPGQTMISGVVNGVVSLFLSAKSRFSEIPFEVDPVLKVACVVNSLGCDALNRKHQQLIEAFAGDKRSFNRAIMSLRSFYPALSLMYDPGLFPHERLTEGAKAFIEAEEDKMYILGRDLNLSDVPPFVIGALLTAGHLPKFPFLKRLLLIPQKSAPDTASDLFAEINFFANFAYLFKYLQSDFDTKLLADVPRFPLPAWSSSPSLITQRSPWQLSHYFRTLFPLGDQYKTICDLCKRLPAVFLPMDEIPILCDVRLTLFVASVHSKQHEGEKISGLLERLKQEFATLNFQAYVVVKESNLASRRDLLVNVKAADGVLGGFVMDEFETKEQAKNALLKYAVFGKLVIEKGGSGEVLKEVQELCKRVSELIECPDSSVGVHELFASVFDASAGTLQMLLLIAGNLPARILRRDVADLNSSPGVLEKTDIPVPEVDFLGVLFCGFQVNMECHNVQRRVESFSRLGAYENLLTDVRNAFPKIKIASTSWRDSPELRFFRETTFWHSLALFGDRRNILTNEETMKMMELLFFASTWQWPLLHRIVKQAIKSGSPVKMPELRTLLQREVDKFFVIQPTLEKIQYFCYLSKTVERCVNRYELFIAFDTSSWEDDRQTTESHAIDFVVPSKDNRVPTSPDRSQIEIRIERNPILALYQLDPDFPEALTNNEEKFEPSVRDLINSNLIKWIRLPFVIGQTHNAVSLFGNSPDGKINVVTQGAVGNCRVISGINCLTKFEEKVKNLFKTKEIQETAEYEVKIYDARGNPNVVKVNDLIPCYFDTSKNQWVPVFAKPTDNAMWGPLFEKALAVHLGGYANLDRPEFDFKYLNGKPTFEVHKQSDNTWRDLDGHIFDLSELLQASLNLGKIAFATVPTPTSKNGIINRHAYSVLDMKTFRLKSKFQTLVKLMNPWGENEWTGVWSDGSTLWKQYPQQAKALRHQPADDGFFWMTLQAFQRTFGVIRITCDVNSPTCIIN